MVASLRGEAAFKAAVGEAAGLEAGIDVGEEPKDPWGANEEKCSYGKPRVGEMGDEDIEDKENSTC